MKRKLFIAAVAAVALAACEEKINEQTVSADEMVELKISIPSAATKVSEKNEPGTPDAVNSLQVFLFDDKGALDNVTRFVTGLGYKTEVVNDGLDYKLVMKK